MRPRIVWLVLCLMLISIYTLSYAQSTTWNDLTLTLPDGWTTTEGAEQLILSSPDGTVAALVLSITPANQPADIDLALETASAMDVALYFATTRVDAETVELEIVTEREGGALVTGSDESSAFYLATLNPTAQTFVVFFAFTPPNVLDQYTATLEAIVESITYNAAPEVAQPTNQASVDTESLFYVSYLPDQPSNQTLNEFDLSSETPRNLFQNVRVWPAAPISPDGNLIAFYSFNNDITMNLHVSDLDCGSACRETFRTVVSNTEQVRYMRWSPDSSRLAYSMVPVGANGVSDLYIVEMATCTRDACPVQQLTDDLSVNHDYPFWSPDGTQLVYEHGSDIWTMNADGSNTQVLTTSATRDVMPHWSPDGQRIAYIQLAQDDSGTLMLVPSDGSSAPQQLATLVENNPGAIPPQWQPSSNNLILRDAPLTLPGAGQLQVFRDGSAVGTTLTSLDQRMAAVLPLGDLAWSPDGTQFLYTAILPTTGEAERFEIYSADPASGRTSAITTGFAAVFSPDGTRIAFIDGINGPLEFDIDVNMIMTYVDNPLPAELGIFIANVDGSERQFLTPVYAPEGLDADILRVFWPG